MNSNKRQLSGSWLLLASTLASLLPLSAIVYALQLLPKLGIVIYKEQFLMWFLTLSLVLTFILIPPVKQKSETQTKVPWYDLILIVLSILAGGYVTFWYHIILPEIGLLTVDKVMASMVGILLLLEATRRHLGWTMACLGIVALVYSYFGNYLGAFWKPDKSDWIV